MFQSTLELLLCASSQIVVSFCKNDLGIFIQNTENLKLKSLKANAITENKACK